LFVSDQPGRYWLAAQVEYLLDQQQDLSLSDVMAAPLADRFEPNPHATLAFGYVDAVYWLRLRVRSLDDGATSWLLDIAGLGRAIDEIDVYVPDASGALQHFQAGDARAFSVRRIR